MKICLYRFQIGGEPIVWDYDPIANKMICTNTKPEVVEGIGQIPGISIQKGRAVIRHAREFLRQDGHPFGRYVEGQDHQKLTIEDLLVKKIPSPYSSSNSSYASVEKQTADSIWPELIQSVKENKASKNQIIAYLAAQDPFVSELICRKIMDEKKLSGSAEITLRSVALAMNPALVGHILLRQLKEQLDEHKHKEKILKRFLDKLRPDQLETLYTVMRHGQDDPSLLPGFSSLFLLNEISSRDPFYDEFEKQLAILNVKLDNQVPIQEIITSFKELDERLLRAIDRFIKMDTTDRYKKFSELMTKEEINPSEVSEGDSLSDASSSTLISSKDSSGRASPFSASTEEASPQLNQPARLRLDDVLNKADITARPHVNDELNRRTYLHENGYFLELSKGEEAQFKELGIYPYHSFNVAYQGFKKNNRIYPLKKLLFNDLRIIMDQLIDPAYRDKPSKEGHELLRQYFRESIVKIMKALPKHSKKETMEIWMTRIPKLVNTFRVLISPDLEIDKMVSDDNLKPLLQQFRDYFYMHPVPANRMQLFVNAIERELIKIGNAYFDNLNDQTRLVTDIQEKANEIDGAIRFGYLLKGTLTKLDIKSSLYSETMQSVKSHLSQAINAMMDRFSAYNLDLAHHRQMELVKAPRSRLSSLEKYLRSDDWVPPTKIPFDDFYLGGEVLKGFKTGLDQLLKHERKPKTPEEVNQIIAKITNLLVEQLNRAMSKTFALQLETLEAIQLGPAQERTPDNPEPAPLTLPAAASSSTPAPPVPPKLSIPDALITGYGFFDDSHVITGQSRRVNEGYRVVMEAARRNETEENLLELLRKQGLDLPALEELRANHNREPNSELNRKVGRIITSVLDEERSKNVLK
jgi:hypothetical protein